MGLVLDLAASVSWDLKALYKSVIIIIKHKVTHCNLNIDSTVKIYNM